MTRPTTNSLVLAAAGLLVASLSLFPPAVEAEDWSLAATIVDIDPTDESILFDLERGSTLIQARCALDSLLGVVCAALAIGDELVFGGDFPSTDSDTQELTLRSVFIDDAGAGGGNPGGCEEEDCDGDGDPIDPGDDDDDEELDDGRG